MPMKTLVFAEKPSVGKDIAAILGARRRGGGFIEGDDYVVTWGFGHLVALAHPEVQNPAWKKWSLHSLPMLPQEWKLAVLPSSKGQFDTVKKLMNRPDVDHIINAADAGREGELIFRLTYQSAGVDKPVQRLWISSMTDEAIKEGFSKLKPGEKYDPLARAALCRSRSDWLVGMNLTRAYTKKANMMLTLGRVQTPTLAMIVDRHHEIQNFVPKDYWEVVADLGDFQAIWFDPHNSQYPSRIDDAEQARQLAERIKGTVARIQSAKKTRKSQRPPFLYDLTSLQRDANSKYSMTAAETLATLQTLYEKRKVVTYPRTDSKHLSEDIFPTISRRLASLPVEYEQYLEHLRANRPKKSKRVFNDAKVSDHHAVIPTEKPVKDTSSWKQTEQDIYDLVVRRFLAAFFPDHKYLSTVVIARSGDDSFKATGKVVTEQGWRALYPSKASASKEKDSGKDEDQQDQTLPDLKKGDKKDIIDSSLQQKKTKPPAAYTEATLLQAMETAGKLIDDEELRDAMKDSGLGTPATRAEIIEKLIRVGYLERDKKRLVPTEKGVFLISIAAQEIKSPELTGSWEKRLSDIARSTDDADKFMQDISGFVVRIVDQIKSDQSLRAVNNRNYRPVSSQLRKSAAPPKPKIEREVFGKCPACEKGNIIQGNRGYGCDRFREGCHYVVWKEFYGKKLSQAAIGSLIKGKPTRVLKGFILENGKKVTGRLSMKSDKSGVELVIESK